MCIQDGQVGSDAGCTSGTDGEVWDAAWDALVAMRQEEAAKTTAMRQQHVAQLKDIAARTTLGDDRADVMTTEVPAATVAATASVASRRERAESRVTVTERHATYCE